MTPPPAVVHRVLFDARRLATTHRANPDALWQLPRDFAPLFSDENSNELVVSQQPLLSSGHSLAHNLPFFLRFSF